MKNRDYKVFGEQGYYHVFNRGNGKQVVFLDDSDRRFFLGRLKENLFPGIEDRPLRVKKGSYVRKQLPAGAFSLLSFCLMPNHFHLLVRQNSSLPVSKLIQKVCTSYSMYFNKKYERAGALFQSKFRAVRVDSDAYLSWVSAYIHQNPTVASLTEKLESYPWSSYLDYLGRGTSGLCDLDVILQIFEGKSQNYARFVLEAYTKIKERKDLKHLLLDSE